MFCFRQELYSPAFRISHSFSPFPYLTWAHFNQTLFFFFTEQCLIMFAMQIICESLRSEINYCHDFSFLDSSGPLFFNCNHYNTNSRICHYTSNIICGWSLSDKIYHLKSQKIQNHILQAVSDFYKQMATILLNFDKAKPLFYGLYSDLTCLCNIL